MDDTLLCNQLILALPDEIHEDSAAVYLQTAVTRDAADLVIAQSTLTIT